MFRTQAPLWKSICWRYIQLRTIVRQSDAAFVELLDHVRRGQTAKVGTAWPAAVRELLLSRLKSSGARVIGPDGEEFPATKLKTTNRAVDDDNDAYLDGLPGALRTYPVRITLPEGEARARAHAHD